MDNKKVLIVDDELCIRQMVSSVLDGNYTVLEASDDEEVINLARKLKLDLILMDILMPKLDGYTACYEIKSNQATRAIPVVMLTGVGYELNKTFSREMGASGYITKPFNLQELLDKVEQFEPVTQLISSS